MVKLNIKFEENINNLKEIKKSILWEFIEISDYIWKSTRIIDSEKEREMKIFSSYKEEYYLNGCEDTLKCGLDRWKLESSKLNNTFPFLIANGNLFSLISILEFYLLKISKELEKSNNNIKLDSIKGNGINKFIKYFEKQNIKIKKNALYSQINCAIVFRNCMYHASGTLEWSKDKNKIEDIIKYKKYLTKRHAAKISNVNIFDSDVGKKLEINNDYVHILTKYIRVFLMRMCNRAIMTINNSNK